ncbi:mitochondrial glycoprotein [Halteromyces radiatus]|uniref:mitochondrial glycoprotein n=1 Tax=Halteromyces radiatus TaxID=101107 RepID=UPI00221E940A|nr:mitochondrial glycoprotein [Halteromyces radiatus]KAI8076873.1 mitochondrial glycoprotein [Halteromyces radiatus]
MASQLLRHSLRTIARANVARPMMNSRVLTIRPQQAILSPLSRSFSVALPRMSAGEADADLVHKLDEELSYEKENEEPTQPAFIKEFLDANSFKLEDKPGHDEVTLTRTFGNETISVLFSISDINNGPADGFLPDEDEVIEEDEVSFPVRASVTIEKNGKGAVTIDTVAQDGEMTVESVMYYKDGKLASDASAESDWQRRGLYIGPQFGELDEGLQSLFEKYLEERGVNAGLATFLPDYVEYKEQKEYTQWLQSVKDFVSA